MSSEPSKWTHPDEFMKLQRLKQKKRQLAARLNQNNNNNSSSSARLHINENDKAKLLEAKLAQKRKNPFAKSIDDAKRQKTNGHLHIEEDSLLDFINNPPQAEKSASPIFLSETPTRPQPAKLVLKPYDPQAFSRLLRESNATAASDDEGPDQQQHTAHLPMDWSLKTRARIFCTTELPATVLKTSQMASGLTSFVRCIDTHSAETSLDISEATRFNQATYYWQHPHLPWLTLFPRTSKDNIGLTIGERERKALEEEWNSSFRGLFQLLRARQCPYFYLCANTFTVLFRAAGVGGCVETHALVTPSTRGMRHALRQEGIEFNMPLKKGAGLNKSADSSFSTTEDGTCSNQQSSNDNILPPEIEENAENPKGDAKDDADDDDDDADEADWLESLGVDEREIRKIRSAQARKVQTAEMSEDFSDNSLLLIEGVECQGFFSYLLNAKSTISSIGRLAGVPPTLLSPVAFPKATMQQLAARSSKVRLDGDDYRSIDIKGIVLPTFLPYVCELLNESKEMYSVTLGSHMNTLAFSKATRKLLETPKAQRKDGEDVQAPEERINDTAVGQVFGQENLSDCGLLPAVIESICRTGEHAVSLLERVCYNQGAGYAWS